MAMTRDAFVTAEPPLRASLGTGARENRSGPAGIWTLTGEALAASDVDGPATVLVPTEGVRLVAVDLPLPTRAKRLAALPFAIEEMIAEPIDAVHLALGAELSPRRYLVGIVGHDQMAQWIARIEDAGLDHAALVPDALALPVPGEGEWAIEPGETRALVRGGDGTGFAVSPPLLRTAWEAAGRPRAICYGAALPGDMVDAADVLPLDALGRRLLAPALDLRQGPYAPKRRSTASFGKALATIAAVGVLAHVAIATADTVALRGIADAREAETRELVAARLHGAALPADDPAGAVADLLPSPGASGGANAYLAASARVTAALAPLGPQVAARSMRLEGGSLIVDLDATDPALADRARAALREAGVAATVASVDGGVRITSPAA
ncbi:type II secretion system protein GspL [Sphingomonas sp.]|uniref:type II secretion system protein GspL n=1 Tax=Sphingomonas sp. TaxID=28214 RepID=UPI002DD63C62|nr:type II secretion system protein GspL [Sphingomonas sp.]